MLLHFQVFLCLKSAALITVSCACRSTFLRGGAAPSLWGHGTRTENTRTNAKLSISSVWLIAAPAGITAADLLSFYEVLWPLIERHCVWPEVECLSQLPAACSAAHFECCVFCERCWDSKLPQSLIKCTSSLDTLNCSVLTHQTRQREVVNPQSVGILCSLKGDILCFFCFFLSLQCLVLFVFACKWSWKLKRSRAALTRAPLPQKKLLPKRLVSSLAFNCETLWHHTTLQCHTFA